MHAAVYINSCSNSVRTGTKFLGSPWHSHCFSPSVRLFAFIIVVFMSWHLQPEPTCTWHNQSLPRHKSCLEFTINHNTQYNQRYTHVERQKRVSNACYQSCVLVASSSDCHLFVDIVVFNYLLLMNLRFNINLHKKNVLATRGQQNQVVKQYRHIICL